MINAIAIDGPSASGKSTIAKKLAKDLNMNYLDTGAMYRAVTYYVLESNIDPEDEKIVISILDKVKLNMNQGSIILNGQDITDRIRSDEIDKAVSPISSYGPVRSMLVKQQQNIAKGSNVILDGRDIGTVVLPNAKLKIFLTASPEVRANRRINDDKSSSKLDFESMLEAVKRRDYLDSHREISPLKAAQDAILIDSSNMTIEEVIDKIKDLWEERKCTQ